MLSFHYCVLCLLFSQYGAWGSWSPPWAEDESSICFLRGGQHASPKKREPQHEVVSAEAATEEGVDEGARKPPEPTLCHLQFKMNALSPHNPILKLSAYAHWRLILENLKLSVADESVTTARTETISCARGVSFIVPFTSQEKIIFHNRDHNWSSYLCTWPLMRRFSI